ncbi:hypothetical protein [Nitrosomonas ureae]|uniref:Uncharacterized protein n=1 Tax=Nitrosomonas ureae TaxID=44577 RepID=A0A1H2HQE6_9PROT|nr:hypothetical protein [Nitrosomonas ureae]ALQ51850.1 hypothetical protein ATY38_11860 [Nitrosomonas ureae]SDU34074.1 hypothetical protein SAMN05216406_1595 [Nitrosomonas ureae]
MALARRINSEAMRTFLKSQSQEEITSWNEHNELRAEEEYNKFEASYLKHECYLCGKPLKTTISRTEPCVHWILRQCKFKKNDFPLLFPRFGYTQIAAFTRWCANQEKLLGAINDLTSQKAERKIFEYTVKWKNIEWTFDCAKNDYTGHNGTQTDFPHYHFQMRIDGKPFINFSDFHIPLSEEDLFHIDLSMSMPDLFQHNFGPFGAGIQAAADADLIKLIQETETSSEEEAAFRFQTIISGKDGHRIQGEDLLQLVKQSQASGETLASLAHKNFSDKAEICTIISPSDNLPKIARRTERKRR